MPASTTRSGDSRPLEPAVATLADLLSSRNRALVLAWVTPRLETPFSLTELARALDVAVSSVQHECYKLERLGLLASRREGNSRRYQVVLDHPLARPLIALVIATLGVESVLREAVAETGTVAAAVIAGPVPQNGARHLTLAMVGHVSLEGLVRAQQRVALALGRPADDVEIAYVQEADWLAGHDLLDAMANRPLQSVVGIWPPPFADDDDGETLDR